ncbi:hypothetical protein [Pseudonocardia sp. HH130630-07]|uniref:hypothetical protein n=1 Tax=Pseudonocardia sp. HH130630-07 TaxID=1690815 RepID=UPI0008153ED6|nr:hypothetical protein [Pseudonocardia sp. HH130630-07]ANY05320.1 hypothetical protein AFB00_02205 [Pseudonocardia sp. HH130630-07]
MIDPAGPRRRLRDHVTVDRTVLLALAAWLAVAAFRWQHPPPAPVWVLHADHVAGLLGCLALCWRQRCPVALAAAVGVTGACAELTAIPTLVLLFTVADRRPAATTAAVACGSFLANAVPFVVRHDPHPANPTPVVLACTAGVYALAVAWGRTVRTERRLADALRERIRTAEVAADLHTERLRSRAREDLTREIHEVLGRRLVSLGSAADALALHRGGPAGDTARAAEELRSGAHRALSLFQPDQRASASGDREGCSATALTTAAQVTGSPARRLHPHNQAPELPERQVEKAHCRTCARRSWSCAVRTIPPVRRPPVSRRTDRAMLGRTAVPHSP